MSRRTLKSRSMYSTPTGTHSKYDTLSTRLIMHHIIIINESWRVQLSPPYAHTLKLICHRTYMSLKVILSVLDFFSPQDCISLGSGEPNTTEYRSFVLYHNNGPRWSEMVKLPIPIDRFRGSHLRFEFRHCSSESVMQLSGNHLSLHGFIRTDGIAR